MTNKDIHFTSGNGDCEYCGISSFDHIHRAGTAPKDFEQTPRTLKYPSIKIKTVDANKLALSIVERMMMWQQGSEREEVQKLFLALAVAIEDYESKKYPQK